MVTTTLRQPRVADAATPGEERRAFMPPSLRKPPARLAAWSILSALHLALESRRFFILLPLAVILGLIISLMAPSAPDPAALIAVALALGAAIPLSWRALNQLRLAILAAAFWLGFGLLSIHGAIFGTPMLARPVYGVYEARVDEIISDTASGRRVILSNITPLGSARGLPVRRARIIVGQGPAIAPGDVIRLPVRFYPVPGPVIPGGFDTQFHAYFSGIGAYGNATAAFEIITSGSASAPDHIINTVRTTIAQRIDQVLPQLSAGIARAIISGDQSEVTDSARNTMATAGIAHVLSVSGLHLTIVAGGVFVVLRMLFAAFNGISQRLSVKRLAAFGGIVASLLYFSISGGNVAALRSTIMIVLVFGAVIFGRRALTIRNVAIAALIVVIIDPASVFRPSFQLSFAAVTALVGFYEMLRDRPRRASGLLGRFGGYFWGITLTSLVAGAATLVFSIYHFQQTSPLGVVGNLVTLPLVGFIMMPMALLAVLAMPFGFEAPFLQIMGWSIDRMLDVAGLVAQWSAALTASPLLTPMALVFGFAALGWFAFFYNRVRLIGPFLLLPLVFLFARDHPPDVLIADTTKADAMRTDEGLVLLSGKPGSFATTIWRDTFAEPLPAAKDGLLTCDSIACVAQSPRGFKVSIVTDPAAFEEDCRWADLVIARIAAPESCNAKTVIDPESLARHGTHWLAWDATRSRFEIREAIADLNRPWRIAAP